MIDFAAQAWAHARHLSEEIGHRPTGSPENQAAADYIEFVFRSSGLAVERQAFACPGWDLQETLLEVDGVHFEGTANWRSQPGDVSGVITPVGSIELLEQADLSGRIALLHGELTQDELFPRTITVYQPPNHQKINQLLDEKRPLGVITVCPLLQSLRHVIKDPHMEIPSATVMPQVGLELLQYAGKRLRLKIVSRRSPGQSWNILGRRDGARAERIVVCAHYDTVWGTPGAYDNASGVSVMLTLAQALADQELPISLEFYASGAEEFGGEGTNAYLERYGLKEIPAHQARLVGERSQVWEPILAAINADGVGLALGANNVTTIAASSEFSALVEATRKQGYPGIVVVDPWPASDHYTFYSHGVPSIALGNTGGLAAHHHQPVDSLEWLNAGKLAEVASFAGEIIHALGDKTSEWCRPAE